MECMERHTGFLSEIRIIFQQQRQREAAVYAERVISIRKLFLKLTRRKKILSYVKRVL